MIKAITFLFKAVFKFVLYVGSSFFLMLTVGSLLSGRFPPPFMEYYRQIKTMGKSINPGSFNREIIPADSSSLSALSEYRKKQEDILKSLNEKEFNVDSDSSNTIAEYRKKQGELLNFLKEKTAHLHPESQKATAEFSKKQEELLNSLNEWAFNVDPDSLKAMAEYRKKQDELLNSLDEKTANADPQARATMAEYRRKQEDLLKSIGEKMFQKSGRGAPDGSTTSEIPAMAAKRIKELEYEVAYYKAKLARSEWERKQLIQSRSPATAVSNQNAANSKR